MSSATTTEFTSFALAPKPEIVDDATNESLKAFFKEYVEGLEFIHAGNKPSFEKVVGIRKNRTIVLWFDQTLFGETWFIDSEGEESTATQFYSGVIARTPQEIQFLIERSLTMQMHVFNPGH